MDDHKNLVLTGKDKIDISKHIARYFAEDPPPQEVPVFLVVKLPDGSIDVYK